MLMIIYRPPDMTNKITVPPLLIPISQSMVIQPCSNLLQPIYQHFKQYLSPFINKNHLQIDIHSQTLNLQLPLFMYLNSNQYIQQCICSIACKDINCQNKKKLFIKNSLIIRKTDQQTKKVLFKTVAKQQLQFLQERIKGYNQLIIQGKQIKLSEGVKLSQILKQSWEKFQTSGTNNIYLKVISKNNLQ